MTAARVARRAVQVIEPGLAVLPGLALAFAAALAANAIAPLIAVAPIMVALVLGVVLRGLLRQRVAAPGVALAARDTLRIGVALLGLKIQFGAIAALGWGPPLIAVAALTATLAAGYWIGRRLGLSASQAAISCAAVAICGASAAATIAAIAPRSQTRAAEAPRVVALVTLVGFAAMLAYPIIGHWMGFSSLQMGTFLGASLHEVAQAVAAGYAVSEPVGAIATAIKLLRVACLAPAAFALCLVLHRDSQGASGEPRFVRPPLFLLVFIALAGAANTGLVPTALVSAASAFSSLCLLAAIVALTSGISLRECLIGGGPCLTIVLLQSVFLAATVIALACLL